MQVSLKLAQPALSTVLDTIVLWATVTSGGQPVPNAAVTFNDTFVSSFLGQTVSTNSTGVALTQLYFINPNPFNDTITAVATASGYSPAKGSVVVYVFPLSNQQLAVTATIVNDGASGGSTEVIQGEVGTVYSSSTKWSGFITGLGDAKVVLSDSIGSTFPKTVTTNDAGFYSTNFTLGERATSAVDIVAASVSGLDYNGSESTFELAVNPYSPKSLTVNLDSIYPSTYSTVLDSVTIQAHVSAGGSPVANASVAFSDSLGAIFTNRILTTDASGIASATVQFIYPNGGLDLFTAQASASGLGPGVGSNTLTVRPYGQQQLAVSEAMASAAPSAGTADTVSGVVGWVSGSTSYAWSPEQNAVPGATVVISDSSGLFAPFTVTANSAGGFSGKFTIPSSFEGSDVVEASASAKGYRGSASSIFMVVGPSQGQGETAPSNGTTSTSTTSATSSTSTPAGLSNPGAGTTGPLGSNITSSITGSTTSVETSSTSTSTAARPPVSGADSAAALLAVVGVVVGVFLLLRVAKVGQRKRAPAASV
jgi:trimeric autotransporter adhesin